MPKFDALLPAMKLARALMAEFGRLTTLEYVGRWTSSFASTNQPASCAVLTPASNVSHLRGAADGLVPNPEPDTCTLAFCARVPEIDVGAGPVDCAVTAGERVPSTKASMPAVMPAD